MELGLPKRELLTQGTRQDVKSLEGKLGQNKALGSQGNPAQQFLAKWQTGSWFCVFELFPFLPQQVFPSASWWY